MADFEESFSNWWKATKQVAGATINAVADAAQRAFSSEEEEKIRIIMKVKNCDEATARAYYAQYLIEQEPHKDGS